MRKHRISSRAFASAAALTLFAAAILWIPLAHAQQTEHAKQLGMKLMCMCGCGQVLVQCNHIGCPSSQPMLKELDAHIARGEADDLVIQNFVQQYGVAVLSSPPNTGFNRVAFLLPGVSFALGLGLILLIISQWRRRKLASPVQRAGVPTGKTPISRELRDQIDRDTEDL
jgi:cytochrome c-type biogenesis protein CcmH/NrfF